MIEAFHNACPGAIVALRRTNEALVTGADYHSEADPEALLTVIARIAHIGAKTLTHKQRLAR